MLALLNEGKNVITEVGAFHQIAKHIKDGKVFISKDIEIKCKTKHRIGNLKSFVSNTLNNLHFVTPYPGDSNVLNFYATVQNTVGRTKRQMVGISMKNGMVTTALFPNATAYQNAMAFSI